MGDRYDRDRKKGLHPALRGLKPPSEIIAWGLTARIGHNQGPPLEEPVAEAAGVSYREYMLELLDTGRHLQAADVAKQRGKR